MYYIVRIDDGPERVITVIEGTKAEVLSKLKSAVAWAEVLEGDLVIIAGKVYILREAVMCRTKDELQKLFGVGEVALV